jgi:hypothetical protein
LSQVSIIDIEGNNPTIPTSFVTDDGIAVPIANVLEILGQSIPAGIIPVHTTGSGNTVTVEVQIAQAIASTNALNVGLSAFNSAQFSVDANGFVSLAGSGLAIDSIGTQTGINPVVPNAAGLVNIYGAVVAAGSNPIRSNGTDSNTATLEVQFTQALVVSDASKVGLSSFNSGHFSVDGSGFVSLLGGQEAIDSIAVQAGTSPIVPTAAGLITINGAVVAAGTNPIRSNGTDANTMAMEVQISQALAAADATKIGLSNYSSTDFAVAATGFVTLATTGAGKTITGDSGGALSPTANNWNIFGLSGSKTSGSGSTLTIKSPPFSQVGTTATSSLNTGEFVTAAVTRTLPASAGLADGDLFIYVCTTSSALVIQSVSAQKIRMGTLLSSAAGTATSTQIGDTISLRFNATDGFFYAVSWVGTWLIA